MTFDGGTTGLYARSACCLTKLASLAACALVLGACYLGSRGHSPTSGPEYKPSPPRYVRITEWLRPNYFAAEFNRGTPKLYDDRFIIIKQRIGGRPIGSGWFAPGWANMPHLPALTPAEEAHRIAMEERWPPGTIVELTYPLVADEDLKIGRKGEVRLDRRLFQEYKGYLIVIKGHAPDSVAIPSRSE